MLKLGAALIAVGISQDKANHSHLSGSCAHILIKLLSPASFVSSSSQDQGPESEASAKAEEAPVLVRRVSSLRSRRRAKTKEISSEAFLKAAQECSSWNIPAQSGSGGEEEYLSVLAAMALGKASRDEIFSRLLVEHDQAIQVLSTVLRHDISVVNEGWVATKPEQAAGTPLSDSMSTSSTPLASPHSEGDSLGGSADYQRSSQRLVTLLNIFENLAHHCSPAILCSVTLPRLTGRSSDTFSSSSSLSEVRTTLSFATDNQHGKRPDKAEQVNMIHVLLDVIALCYQTLPKVKPDTPLFKLVHQSSSSLLHTHILSLSLSLSLALSFI